MRVRYRRLFFLASMSFGLTALSLAQGLDNQRGSSYSGTLALGQSKLYIEDPNPPLQAIVEDLEDPEVVQEVGGVAFGAEAIPGPGLADKNIALRYERSEPDGQRLIVSFDSEPYPVDLPDWQLIPIVRYASSKYNACISLFGASQDEDSYAVRYHTALEDTLLGLRLFQADILLMNLNDSWDLPRFNGNLILGSGETPPDKDQAMNVIQEIDRIMGTGSPYRSWILTDDRERVQFSVNGENRLELTGDPYFYFWDTNRATYEKRHSEHLDETSRLRTDIDRRQARAGAMNDEIQRLVNEHNQIVRDFNKLSTDQSEDARKKRAEYQAEMDFLTGRIEKQKQLLATWDTETQSLVEQHNRTIADANALRPDVVEVTSLTNALQGKRDALETFNPAVFNAARRTMRFAAFFRYVKRHNNQAWLDFSSQLAGVEPGPTVRTPTRIPKPVAVRQATN